MVTMEPKAVGTTHVVVAGKPKCHRGLALFANLSKKRHFALFSFIILAFCNIKVYIWV